MPEPSGAADPLHVLLIHQLFVAGDQAGGTRHAELARHLAAGGHRFTVVTDRGNYMSGRSASSGHASSSDPYPGVTVHRVPTVGGGRGFAGRVTGFLSFTAASFLRGLAVRDVDAVYATTPPLPQAATGLALARLKGVPLVLEVRDLWPDFAVELGVLKDPALIAASRRLEHTLYRAADVVVVNSPGFVEHVRAGGAEHVVVVPNGVDADAFDPGSSGRDFRREHGLDGKFVVLYAGAHGVPNDLSTVLDAAEALGGTPEVVFALVGDGRDKERLVADAERRGLTNVRFVGPQPKSRMPEVLAAADLGLATLKPLPLFGTVFPNKVFDYMAAGRPTLLLIDGVIREIVEDGDAGAFVPPGDGAALADAVLGYLADPDLRARQGRSARAVVETSFRRSEHAEALGRLLLALKRNGVR